MYKITKNILKNKSIKSLVKEMQEVDQGRNCPGDWAVIQDETYCGGFGCTPDGCSGHYTGQGTQVDGPFLVDIYERGMDETDEEVAAGYKRSCADATFIAYADNVWSTLIDLLQEIDQERNPMP